MHGLVIKNTGSWYQVKTDEGQVVDCKIKGNFRLKGIRSTNPIAVGDKVDITLNNEGTAFITSIDERKNYIVRRSSNLSKQSHIIAANLDQSFLIVTVNYPETSTIFIDRFLATAEAYRIPVHIVINKCDVRTPDAEFLEHLKQNGIRSIVAVSSIRKEQRERFLADFKQALIENCPDDFLTPPPLVGDLIRPGDLVVLIVPIDLQAPKGRLILPQVQTIRDVLDHDAAVLTVKENEYLAVLDRLKTPPALVVCDSQVVRKMVDETPAGVPCTTFSILFSRLKGDMRLMAEGTAAIDTLRKGDKVLIAEACTHHATQDDIGRVKIPRWLKNYLGDGVEIDVYAGRDYPENFSDYKLVIHCGGCMLNRREVLSRLQTAAKAGVPVTNYGMCISLLQGVLDRVLSPFPEALAAFRNERERLQKK